MCFRERVLMTSTAFITHRDCWLHNMGSIIRSLPERLAAINDRLIAAGLDMYLVVPRCTAGDRRADLPAHPRPHVEESWPACPSTASATSTRTPRCVPGTP